MVTTTYNGKMVLGVCDWAIQVCHEFKTIAPSNEIHYLLKTAQHN